MGYQKDREEFVSRFPGTYADAIAFLRDSSAEQVWNEKQCSFEMSDREIARQEKRSENRIKRVQERAARLGFKVDTSGDPRGNPFCLLVGHTDNRLSIPARGLPARCFR